ncbi:MAG: hypothetical protein SWZ49_33595 [Cyanobacteriota bacterium]|nr:hypothetical protein [Cyanobacteriota bacterium]
MSIARIIFLLFFPACIAILLKQVIWGSELTHQLLAFGTFLFCIEQANMANQDLQKVSRLQKQIKDVRLNDFYRITIITIILELMGFYLSSIWLGWGFLLILISLIFFNLFVEINIHTSTVNAIHNWKITERFPVLIADAIAFILVSLWMLRIGDFWISWGLFSMAIFYCFIKFLLFFKSLNFVGKI